MKCLAGVLLAIVALLIAPKMQAQDSVPSKALPIYVIAHIDAMPDKVEIVTSALTAYVKAERQDPDVLEVKVLQQVSPLNHFTMVEILKDQQAYERHVEAAYTRKFRGAIQAALGSPYDERLHHLMLRK